MLYVGGGGGRAVVIGEEGRCPRECPGSGPEAARMASAAIGDVAAESMMEGVRGNPEFAGGGAPEVVAEVVCPLAIDLVVAILVSGGGSRMRGGERVVGGEGARCKVVNFV